MAWLSGTVLTGLTGILLMAAALYLSFRGQASFSTAYEALEYSPRGAGTAATPWIKTARARPVTLTHSESETIEASIRQDADGTEIIRQEQFTRINATLSTIATSLSDDVPPYEPSALLAFADARPNNGPLINTDVYGAEVEGEVAVHLSPLPVTYSPSQRITDAAASAYVKAFVSAESSEGDDLQDDLPPDPSLRDLGPVQNGVVVGSTENVSIVPKNRAADDATQMRTERILTVREPSSLESVLLKNGFTLEMIGAITATLKNIYPSTDLPQGARLRILFGPSRSTDTLIPYRMSIYLADKHAATVALTDNGEYVLALAPPEVKFPADDAEDVSVASLPSLYRSIWETGRKHDLSEDLIKQIEAMYAYEIDLTKKITPGDSINILESAPDPNGKQELIYVGVVLDGTPHELFRFRDSEGATGFFDPDGESGKPFLERRPLRGGGLRISSPFGWRIHPIFHTRTLHEGVDFASTTGVPIYAAGDGVVEKAGWASGYGQFVLLKHVNGFETGYAHMSKIAAATMPGASVRQGQIIGYVGSTGNSTGPHLHYEIRINGHFVDPLSVRLPRTNTLPAQDDQAFATTVSQVRDLMQRAGTSAEIASK